MVSESIEHRVFSVPAFFATFFVQRFCIGNITTCI